MMTYWQTLKNSLTLKIIFGSLLLLLVLIPFDEGGNKYILPLITQVVLLGSGILWAILAIHRRQVTACFDWIDLFVAGFVLWAVISFYHSVYKYATFLELIKIISYAAVFYLGRLFFPLREKRTTLLFVIFGSTLLQLLISLYSYVIVYTPFLQAGFVDPNMLACFFVVGINIALSFLLFSNESAAKTRIHEEKEAEKNSRAEEQHLPISPSPFLRPGVFAALCGLIIALLALRSRGAFIGFAGSGVLLTTLRKKRLGLLFLAGICVMLLLPLPGGSMIQRLRKLNDPFAYERIGIWKSDLRMIADYPIFGVGLGLYNDYSRPYNFPVEHRIARYEKQINVAHSDILQIGAEMGIVGVILFLGGVVRLGYAMLRRCAISPVTWQCAAASAGIVSVLIQGIFSTLLSSPAIAITMVVLGVIVFDEASIYRQRAYAFAPSWRWYAGLGLLAGYILIPVILYPFFGHVYSLKYQKLRQARDISGAVAALQTAIKFVPNHAYYHYMLGELYLIAFRNQPNPDAFYGGYKELTQAIRYHSRNAQFHLSLAELHRAMYRQLLPTKPTAQNAIREYQQAIADHPFNPFMRFSLATLYADIEEFDLALAALQEAVQIEPNFVGGYQMSGKLLQHLQRDEEADAMFAHAAVILRQYPKKDYGSPYVNSLLQPLQ